MEVMLVNVKMHVLVKSEMPLVSFVNKGLYLVDNHVPCSYCSWSPKELGMLGPKCLPSVLGLLVRLAVGPPAGLSPNSVEDVIHSCRVSDEGSLEGTFMLKYGNILSEVGSQAHSLLRYFGLNLPKGGGSGSLVSGRSKGPLRVTHTT